MNTRIDWYHDPEAPAVNSLVPSASVIITDRQDRVLLIQRADNGNWAIPGGAHDLGESLPQTAIRECKEETGYDIELISILGTFTDPQNIVEFTSNGEVRQEFSVVFLGRVVSGTSRTSAESRKVAWIEWDEISSLQMAQSMRVRLRAWQNEEVPWLG